MGACELWWPYNATKVDKLSSTVLYVIFGIFSLKLNILPLEFKGVFFINFDDILTDLSLIDFFLDYPALFRTEP